MFVQNLPHKGSLIEEHIAICSQLERNTQECDWVTRGQSLLFGKNPNLAQSRKEIGTYMFKYISKLCLFMFSSAHGIIRL